MMKFNLVQYLFCLLYKIILVFVDHILNVDSNRNRIICNYFRRGTKSGEHLLITRAVMTHYQQQSLVTHLYTVTFVIAHLLYSFLILPVTRPPSLGYNQ